MASRKAAVESERDRQGSAGVRAPAPAKRTPAAPARVTVPVKRAPAKPAPAAPEPEVVERVESKKVKAARAKMKIPKKIGAVADLYYTHRQDRLELQHGVDAAKDEETVLKNYLIDNLPKSEATGAAGKVARAQIYTVEEPQVQNWEEFYKHVKKTGQFDLLNRALNGAAVKERWNAGKTIPGVGSFTVTKVSITKVS